MMNRRLQRQYKGVYRQDSIRRQIFTWSMVLYVVIVLFAYSFTSKDGDDTSVNVISRILFCLFIVSIIVKVALLIQWMIYWVIVSLGAAYLITGEFNPIIWNQSKISVENEVTRNTIVTLLVIAEILTVFWYLFTHYFYPWLVLSGKLSQKNWWKVTRGMISNTLYYTSMARSFVTPQSKRFRIEYCGGLDENRCPHGYGIWSDTHYHGERLAGLWDHGIPIGPFRSHEHGSGYSFVNLRIAYCSNRGETKGMDNFYFPKHSKEGLKWGVASIECSVSGGFFTFLPQLQHLTPLDDLNKRPQNAKECLPFLQTPVQQVLFQNDPRGTNLVDSFCTDQSKPTEELEAMVFIHGYNCPLDYALQRFAQLVALGNFPMDHIHSYVFSWPSAGTLAAFDAIKIGAQSDQTAQDLHDFLKSLIQDAGYTKINIIVHSMGARLYFNALKRRKFDELFVNLHDTTQGHREVHGSKKAFLATLTLCNPDYPLKEFVKYGGTYDLTRQFCQQITLYGDNLDGALVYSEWFFKDKWSDPTSLALGKRVTQVHRDPEDRRPQNIEEIDQGILIKRVNSDEQIQVDTTAVHVNEQGGFSGVVFYAYNRLQPVRLPTKEKEQHVQSEFYEEDPSKRLKYLDIDVIDTTWMDSNVHAIRHNYFNINPTLVDDLRHLIVNKTRAKERPGLLNSTGNLYIFLVAPSFIKNQ